MRLHTVIKIISYKLIFTYEIAHNNESDVSPSKAGDCLWFHVTAMVVPMAPMIVLAANNGEKVGEKSGNKKEHKGKVREKTHLKGHRTQARGCHEPLIF